MAIITFFKVLPTDDRYRNLNLAQKLVILSAIGDHYSSIGEMINLGMQRFDALFGAGAENNEFVHENSFFEQQSYMGRLTGKLHSPPIMQRAIKQFYEDERKRKQEQGLQTEELG